MDKDQLAALTATHMCECGPDPAHCEADGGSYPCDAAQLLTALAEARLDLIAASTDTALLEACREALLASPHSVVYKIILARLSKRLEAK